MSTTEPSKENHMHNPVTATTSAIDRDRMRPRAIDLRRPGDRPGAAAPKSAVAPTAAIRDELGRALTGVLVRDGERL
jgi:hypothetical protein